MPPGLVSEISVSRPGSSQALWIVLHWTAIKSLVGEPTPQTLRTTCPSMGLRERLCQALTGLWRVNASGPLPCRRVRKPIVRILARIRQVLQKSQRDLVHPDAPLFLSHKYGENNRAAASRSFPGIVRASTSASVTSRASISFFSITAVKSRASPWP